MSVKALTQAAAVEALALSTAALGTQRVGEALRALRNEIDDVRASLSPAGRTEFDRALIARATAYGIHVLRNITNPNGTDDDIEDGGGGGGGGFDDGPSYYENYVPRDVKRIESRRIAFALESARALGLIERVLQLLLSHIDCDNCTNKAVVYDSVSESSLCVQCDKRGQIAYSDSPSFTRWVLTLFHRVKVPTQLKPNEFVSESGDGTVSFNALPEPIKVAAICELCVHSNSNRTCSRWVADKCEDKCTITVFTPDGTFSAARAITLRCTGKKCTNTAPAGTFATIATSGASLTYATVSLHTRISISLLDTYAQLNLVTKHGITAEAVVSHLSSMCTAGDSNPPEEAVRAALFAHFAHYACVKDELYPTRLVCLRCPSQAQPNASTTLPVEVRASHDTPLAVGAVGVDTTMETVCEVGNDTAIGEAVSGVGTDLITEDEFGGGLATQDETLVINLPVPSSDDVYNDTEELHLQINRDLRSTAPCILFVDGNMKLFVYKGTGGGDGMILGDDQIVCSLTSINLILEYWRSLIERNPPPSGTSDSACSGGDADFTASSEGDKSGSRPLQLTGEVLAACPHDAYFTCLGLPKGEQHVYHLMVLLRLARSLGDVILFSDITCMLMRTFARLAANDPAFIFKIVEMMWPGEYSAAMLTTEKGADHAVFCKVVFIRVGGAIESARVRVIIDALHCEGHLCVWIYGAPFKVGAGTGAPSIESTFNRLGPRFVSLRKAATSTHDTLLNAQLQQWNAFLSLNAVVDSARHWLQTLDRRTAAEESFMAEMALLVPRPTSAELGGVIAANQLLVDTPRKPVSVGKAFILANRATTLVFQLRSLIASITKRATRSNSDDDANNSTIQDFFSNTVIPLGFARPRFHSYNEATRLLELWEDRTATVLRKARPEIARDGELVDATILRLVSGLRVYFVEFKRLTSAIKGDAKAQQKVVNRLVIQRSTVVRGLDASLKSLSAYSARSLHKDLQSAVWPTVAIFCAGENVADVLPKRFAVQVPGIREDIGKAAVLSARLFRRREEVAMAEQVNNDLPGNLKYAASILELQAKLAAAFIRSPPATEEEILIKIGRNYIFPSSKKVGDQPLSTPRGSLLLGSHVLSPKGLAALLLLISRNTLSAARLRLDADGAERLLAAQILVPSDSQPSWDIRQIYATRYISQLLAGKCSPVQFASYVTTDRGHPRRRVKVKVPVRSVDTVGDDEDGVHEGVVDDESDADDSDDVVVVEDDESDDDDDADDAAEGTGEATVESGGVDMDNSGDNEGGERGGAEKADQTLIAAV